MVNAATSPPRFKKRGHDIDPICQQRSVRESLGLPRTATESLMDGGGLEEQARTDHLRVTPRNQFHQGKMERKVRLQDFSHGTEKKICTLY